MGKKGGGGLPHELLRKQTHERSQQGEQGRIEVQGWQRDRKGCGRWPTEQGCEHASCEHGQGMDMDGEGVGRFLMAAAAEEMEAKHRHIGVDKRVKKNETPRPSLRHKDRYG